jgi:hypothetical protein
MRNRGLTGPSDWGWAVWGKSVGHLHPVTQDKKGGVLGTADGAVLLLSWADSNMALSCPGRDNLQSWGLRCPSPVEHMRRVLTAAIGTCLSVCPSFWLFISSFVNRTRWFRCR